MSLHNNREPQAMVKSLGGSHLNDFNKLGGKYGLNERGWGLLNTGSRKALQNPMKIKYLQVGSCTEVRNLGSIEAG